MSQTDPQDAKTERFEARMTPRQKRLFQKAADLRGQSLTDFALTHLQEVSEKVIRECEVMELTTRDSRILMEAFLNPPEPNQKLRQAVRTYQQGISF